MSKTRKKKTKRSVMSKAENAALIAQIFGMKANISYEERVELAENAYAFLNDMKTDPCGENFINLVDVMNIFVTLINITDTKKKCKRAYNCPNALQWLFERGYDYIVDTINECQESLIRVEQRVNEKGSWAMDAGAISLMETCIKWYEELCSVMPRALVLHCVKQCEGKHKKTEEGHRISHFLLDEEYAEKEMTWHGKSDEVANVGTN